MAVMSTQSAASEKPTVETQPAPSRASSPNTPAQLERAPHAGCGAREAARSAAFRALSFREGLPRPDAAEMSEAMQSVDYADACLGSRGAAENGACMQQWDGAARVSGGVSSSERQNEPLLQDNEDRFCMYPIRCCRPPLFTQSATPYPPERTAPAFLYTGC